MCLVSPRTATDDVGDLSNLIKCRMVLYFPVSALVTLFGNILQNPLDPKARSDTKLMNVVVNFLSMLGVEAETGGVHRMLGVCSEFERIAKVVIEKAEKEHATRRKRKNMDQSSSKTSTVSKPANSSESFNPNPTAPLSRPTTSSSATPQASHDMNMSSSRHLSPQATDQRSPPQNGYSHGHTPMAGTMSQSPSPGMAPTGWHNDFTPPPSGDTTAGPNSDYGSYADMAGYGSAMGAMNAAAGLGGPGGGGMMSPPMGGEMGAPPPAGVFFQQPVLPPDLFSLPMTLDWDWAEMSGGAYPSVENGNFGA